MGSTYETILTSDKKNEAFDFARKISFRIIGLFPSFLQVSLECGDWFTNLFFQWLGGLGGYKEGS
jgi:hypothetical protein